MRLKLIDFENGTKIVNEFLIPAGSAVTAAELAMYGLPFLAIPMLALGIFVRITHPKMMQKLEQSASSREIEVAKAVQYLTAVAVIGIGLLLALN